MQLDLNADLGESYGSYRMGDDEALLEIVSSANVACGFHAGGPNEMITTVRSCVANGVSIGAHPGFRDLEGFGRRRMQLPDEEIRALLAYQIGALQAVAAAGDATVTHVKLHGALANMASESDDLADICVRAIQAVDPELRIIAMTTTAIERAAAARNIPFVREIYADRAYNDDGTLVSRGTDGAVIHDAEEAADRVVAMIETGSITTISGATIPVSPESVCVHGDHPESVAMARRVREAIEAAGHAVVAF